MKGKEESLIKLIQSARLEGPSPEFTENVIAFLKEEVSRVEDMNGILEHHLKGAVLPKVREDFSTKTMAALENRVQPPVFEPLIFKRTRTVLLVSFILGYGFLLLDELFLNVLYVSDESFFQFKWFTGAPNIHNTVWIGVFALMILLLLDAKLKRKKSFVP